MILLDTVLVQPFKEAFKNCYQMILPYSFEIFVFIFTIITFLYTKSGFKFCLDMIRNK